MRPAQGSASGARADLGTQLGKAIRSNLKGNALEDVADLEQGSLQLLGALHAAYSDAAFQSEIRELHEATAGDELKFVTSLAPLAARVQAPVFERFGLPAGQRGVMLMKMGVKLVAKGCPRLSAKAGDLRELLLLAREEESGPSWGSTVESGISELVGKLERAPPAVRGPLAEALRLPPGASAREIALEVPKIRDISRDIAETHMAKGRSAIVGPGKVLGPDMSGASDEELRAKLAQDFEHYLTKMLARVVTPVTSFTRAPPEFRCGWADGVVRADHARELWGPPSGAAGAAGAAWRSLGVGLTVIDGAVGRELILPAVRELADLQAAGSLDASRDPCNVGARSVWLHASTDEERSERQRATPALLKLCALLFGLPFALDAAAKQCVHGDLDAPKLLVHPHVMAATYGPGAEYHCHKDSYGGMDNQRMVTVLLYLNDEWRPGDGGELRIFGSADGGSKPDQGSYVDIEPLAGRLVLFRAREVWHAVLEPRKPRWAMTLWVMAE